MFNLRWWHEFEGSFTADFLWCSLAKKVFEVKFTVCCSYIYSGISKKLTLYKADISLRQKVYLGTDGLTVKLLFKILYKADSRKTDTFFMPQMTVLPISIKRTQVQKQFSRKKICIFFEKVFLTMFYSLVYILKNFFCSVLSH